MSSRKRKLRAKLDARAESQQITQRRIEQFSGPIPSPDILERYNAIVPDAAERILKMAESDASHQREIELTALNTQRRERRLGQIFGFTIGVVALSVSALALVKGSAVAASVIGGTTVVGLVAVFVTGRIAGTK